MDAHHAAMHLQLRSSCAACDVRSMRAACGITLQARLYTTSNPRPAQHPVVGVRRALRVRRGVHVELLAQPAEEELPDPRIVGVRRDAEEAVRGLVAMGGLLPHLEDRPVPPGRDAVRPAPVPAERRVGRHVPRPGSASLAAWAIAIF